MAFGEDGLGEAEVGAVLGAEGIGHPIELNMYQNTDDKVIGYWSYSPFTTALSLVVWEIQTDLVDTFDSPDLRSYTSDTIGVDNFIIGSGYRGVVLPLTGVYPRLQSEDQTMYWRVRATYEGSNSDWATGEFTILAAVNEETRSSLLSFLPDALFDKGEDSNVYKLHDAVATEFELANRNLTLVNGDLYIKSVRDQSISRNFTDLLQVDKPGAMAAIDYREILRAYMGNVRTAPARLAARNLLFSVYHVEPNFVNLRDRYGVYQSDIGIPEQYVEDAGIPMVYVWDNEHLAGGVIIEVSNQLPITSPVTKAFVEGILRKMVQTHTPVFLSLIQGA